MLELAAAMTLLAALHGLSDPRSGGSQFTRKSHRVRDSRPSGSDQHADCRSTICSRKATPQNREFRYTPPEIVDGLNASKQRLLRDFKSQPPEVQKQRQAVLDTIEEQPLLGACAFV